MGGAGGGPEFGSELFPLPYKYLKPHTTILRGEGGVPSLALTATCPPLPAMPGILVAWGGRGIASENVTADEFCSKNSKNDGFWSRKSGCNDGIACKYVLLTSGRTRFGADCDEPGATFGRVRWMTFVPSTKPSVDILSPEPIPSFLRIQSIIFEDRSMVSGIKRTSRPLCLRQALL